MHKKTKNWNSFLKNLDNKNYNKKHNLPNDKKIKNNLYNLSLQKDINPLFINHNNNGITKSLKNNQLENYLLSTKKNKNLSNLIFNNEIKNQISLGNSLSNKDENSFKSKHRFKNIYNNKSEVKINSFKEKKILFLKNMQNNHTINQSKIYKNNSGNIFPLLDIKFRNEKEKEKEKIFNINSVGNIINSKNLIRKNMIGKMNFNLLNNKSSKNIKNGNELFLQNSDASQSLNSNILFTDNYNKNLTKNKYMFKYFSKIKNKFNSKIYLFLNSNTITQNNTSKKEKKNNNITSENMIKNQIKKYFSVNKLRKKENIKDNENISKESYESPEFKNSNTYNFKDKNNDNHFYNKKINLKVISDKNEEKDKNKENIYNKINAYNFNESENKEDKIYKNSINNIIKGLENILEDKNESNFNVSNNTVKKRPIEVNNSKNELSFISCSKSSIYDVNYYMNESNKLSEHIKEYFKINKKYPYSKIDFYKFGRKIGQGAFGKVNIGLHILTGRVVAIKSFKKQNCTEKNMERIINERDIMKELNNKNIIKILDYFEDENYIFIVMEYINGGNLYSFIKKRMKLKEKMAKYIFKQIISAINYIHKHNIVHKDIKLENILLDINHGIKICDFGIAKKVYSPDQLFYGISGTPLYMAPEIFYKSNFGYEGFPVDAWACGIALYIMLSGELPFKTDKSIKKDSELEYAILNTTPKEIENISEEAKDLIKGLLCKNPSKRLTCEEILKHPWLKDDEKKENDICQLFTKNEMVMLSKSYIDYRKDKNENLKEYFNISNLFNDDNEKDDNQIIDKECLKNNQSKSVILTPFNTMLSSDNENILNEQKDFLDIINKKIRIQNNIIEIGNKVKQHYRLYELNNNHEIDNGIMIYSQLLPDFVNAHKNFEEISMDENTENRPTNEIDTQINEKRDKILYQMENFGFNKEYLLKCLKNNELNYCTATYFLLINYEDIK